MPTLRQLAAVFFRAGNTTFGGGDPTIAVLQREFERRGWLTAEQFVLAYGLARVTPGTNVVAFCAGAAWLMLGVAGAVVAVLVVTIPSAVLVIWLTRICELGATNRWARAAITGTVAAAVGTMLAAALYLTRLQLRKTNWPSTIAIVVAAFVLAQTFKLSPIQILGLAAATGLIWSRP
jgi:chromate transporter